MTKFEQRLNDAINSVPTFEQVLESANMTALDPNTPHTAEALAEWQLGFNTALTALLNK